jgi:hypothetical protein
MLVSLLPAAKLLPQKLITASDNVSVIAIVLEKQCFITIFLLTPKYSYAIV